MKRFTKNLVLVLIIMVGVFSLTGCGKEKEKKKEKLSSPIVGTWVSQLSDSFVYYFEDDGTGVYDVSGTKMKFTYKIDGDKISISYEGNDSSFDTVYTIENDVLNIKDSFGEDTLYTRKK